MTDPRSFGLWLCRERERRGISVRAVADRTKIGAGHIESLERGDVSRWPAGIYRRSFIKGYCDAVGLDADLVVANFERVFPDPEAPAAAPAPAPAARTQPPPPADAGQGLRMTLAAPPAPSGIQPSAVRAAAFDLAFVLGFGLLGLAAAGAIGFWSALAVAAVVYHTCGVLGIRPSALPRLPVRAAKAAPARNLAQVVSFSDEQQRATSRLARARRMAGALSAAAIPSVTRRRAAR